MFTVYVIQSQSSGKIYIGQTGNMENRLKGHNQILKTKETSYTKLNRGPWKLVYEEQHKTRSEAIKREKQLKSYKGRQFIKTILGP